MIAATESMAADDYRQMLIESNADDIQLTAEVTGIPANMLRKSLERSGFKPEAKHDGFNLLKEIETLKALAGYLERGSGRRRCRACRACRSRGRAHGASI